MFFCVNRFCPRLLYWICILLFMSFCLHSMVLNLKNIHATLDTVHQQSISLRITFFFLSLNDLFYSRYIEDSR